MRKPSEEDSEEEEDEADRRRGSDGDRPGVAQTQLPDGGSTGLCSRSVGGSRPEPINREPGS